MSKLLPFILLTTALWCGCTELGEQPFGSETPDAGAATPDASSEPLTLSELHDRIFSGCSCHLASTPAAELDLSRAVIHAQLVDRASMCDGATPLVIPGDPDGSFLVEKIAARTEGGQPSCGSGMPLVGAAVSQSDLDALRTWIAAGAQDTQ